MNNISYPKCERSGVKFIISTNEDLSENVWFFSDDFPIAMYTQSYNHEASAQIPFHWHNEIQITWVYQGTLSYCINGETFVLDRSKLLFINSHILHSSKTINENARTLCIDFNQTIFHPMILKYYVAPVLENSACTFMLVPLNPYQLDILEKFTTWNEKTLGYFPVTNFLSQLVEDIVKNFEGRNVPANFDEAYKFNQILEYVHSHYSEPLAVKDIAGISHINKNKLTILFDKYTNMSPIKYLNEYRLYNAKNMIVGSDMSISRISEEVGFNQLSHFVQQFKRSYGLTPLKYRKKYSNVPNNPETPLNV